MFNKSKYRNCTVTTGKKNWYSFASNTAIHVSGSEPCPIKATKSLVAFRSGNLGGAVGVHLLANAGRSDTVLSFQNGARITDLDWAPWNLSDGFVLSTGDETGAVKLWHVPCSASELNNTSGLALPDLPALTLPAELKHIETVMFHPIACNLLSVASAAQVKLWDISHETMAITLDCSEVVQTISWKEDGQLLVSISKDNMLRVFDPRVGSTPIKSVNSHNGIKPSRVVWAGASNMIFSTGFNSKRDREYSIWDFRNFTQSLVTNKLDTSPGILTPLYDSDTKMMFLSGKGDTSVWWLELKPENEKSPVDVGVYPYVGSVTFSGACLVPKLGLDIMGCEVARVLNVASDGSNIIPVSAVVPRKTHADFHADIFPDTREDIPQVAVTEWLTGINTTPRIVSLDPAKRQSFAPVTTTESTASLSTLPNQIQPLLDSTKNSISDIQMQINTPDSASTTIPTAIKNSAKVNLPKHSAYRFITGKSNTDYDDLKGLSVNFPNETDAFQINSKFIAFSISGPGGRVGVWPVESKGRFPVKIPCIVNGSEMLDFRLDPFNVHRLITGCEDGRIRIFDLPANGLTDDLYQENNFFPAHNGRVVLLQFHPMALDIIMSYSPEQGSPLIKIWNICTKKLISTMTLPDQALSVAFSYDGNCIAAILRDKTIRVYDSHTGLELQSGPSHQGTKAARILWIGDTGRLVSVGYARANQREIIQYDSQNLTLPVCSTPLDTSPSMLIPFYDHDTGLLILCGRGESVVTFYHLSTEPEPLFLTRYSVPGGIRQLSMALLPKRHCNVKEIEVLKGFRLTPTSVESISFTVPRLQKEYFQDDIFVSTRDVENPALSADEWTMKKSGTVKLIDLKPADMQLLSTAPVEQKVIRKTVDLVVEQTEYERKEASIKAMFDIAMEKSKQGPLPQDLIEGVADDEWD
ncbi:hypothetical protein O5D80_002354 [Batrachochytrium dendrobatidis]|nr:hypothetical protein O5D80_002354 [Batrachochytrium dendrobatidis]